MKTGRPTYELENILESTHPDGIDEMLIGQGLRKLSGDELTE